jgi:hypothetical protein
MTPVTAPCVQWTPVDIGFRASVDGTNPYPRQHDPFLQVTFKHAENTYEITLEGYWDGGRDWRVRFAPPLAGLWKWQAVSPDTAVDGLSGSIECTVPSRADLATNANLRGHLKVSPNGRYFTYADGTPFLLLGDTNWSLNTDRCGLDTDGAGPLRTYLEDRRAKGYTAIFTELVEIDQPNEAGYPFPDNTSGSGDGDYGRLNTGFFQRLDARMRLLWDMGFVVAAHPTWVGKQTGMPVDVTRLLTRHLLARYGAFNLIWSLSGEYQYAYTNKLYPWTSDDWRQLGRDVARWNPYGHPVSVHPSGRQGKQAHPDWPAASGVASSAGEFHNEPWLDHNWLQTGQSVERLWRVPSRVAENYSLAPVKPVIHAEGFYENHKPDGATPEQTRYQAWSAFLNGAAGHVYGGAGVWQFYDPDCSLAGGKDRVNSRPPGGTDWRGALDHPGACQLGHLSQFMASVAWWQLSPCRERLLADDAAPDMQDLTAPHCATVPGKLWVAYIPSGNVGKRLTIEGFDLADPSCCWLNPRDGNRAALPESNDSNIGDPWTLPTPPDDRDWVFIAQST